MVIQCLTNVVSAVQATPVWMRVEYVLATIRHVKIVMECQMVIQS